MLAGLTAGQIQLLKPDSKSVKVSRNDIDIIGWSADEILRDLQDIRNPTDLATDHDVTELQGLEKKGHRTKSQEERLAVLRRTIGDRFAGGIDKHQLRQFRQILDRAVEKGALAKKGGQRRGPRTPSADVT